MDAIEDTDEALASRVLEAGPGGAPEAAVDETGPAVGGTAADAGEEFAKRLGAKRREAGAPVRNWFVANDNPDVRPPLAQLLSSGRTGGGGRGGQLRVKLYLSLLWICAAAPYETVRPGRAWPACSGSTTRKSTAPGACRQRCGPAGPEHGHHPGPGRLATAVTPLIEHGTGAPYSSPSEMHNQLRQHGASNDQLAGHRYFRLPSAVWTQRTAQPTLRARPGDAARAALRTARPGWDAGVVLPRARSEPFRPGREHPPPRPRRTTGAWAW
ncbi:hypothetical protein Ae717Ps2_6589c [Pseudonocardia sp. Ae717_Ps2]|nr:hypothetical protein Ae717Ps2_6589c [Pseudonocardia sp. Ae717_Ps2]